MPQENLSLYCVACNRCFTPGLPAGECPRCRAPLQTVPSYRFMDTLEFNLADGDAASLLERAEGESSALASADPLLGTTLHVYECESLLGRGGMGQVYLARHLDLGRHCAVKVLDPQFSSLDDDYLDRFMHEGRSAAALNHPHIVTTHAIGEADGMFFLEMEFLPGGSLQQYLQTHGRLHPLGATEMLIQIARGLAEAHRTGIVHRDLKLDNVLLTRQSIAKIGDFGLAKRLVNTPANNDVRRLIGTPHYMAPELFAGETATTSSDVYALGVCYFVLMTGRAPFSGQTLSQLIDAIQSASLPNLRDEFPDIPLEFCECLHLLMSPSRIMRPKDGVEALHLLEAILGEHRDLESLCREAFREDESDAVNWKKTDKGLLLTLKTPGNRTQRVCLEIQQSEPGQDAVKIYSICCEADGSFYEQALKLNAEILHGGLAIHEIEGRQMFVLIDTYPLSTIDPLEIRRSVLEAGAQADAVEKLLTQRDFY
ncbi:MAG: serine/threonine-protein kinase [Planctomycetaceae bacterium]